MESKIKDQYLKVIQELNNDPEFVNESKEVEMVVGHPIIDVDFPDLDSIVHDQLVIEEGFEVDPRQVSSVFTSIFSHLSEEPVESFRLDGGTIDKYIVNDITFFVHTDPFNRVISIPKTDWDKFKELVIKSY